MFKYNYFSNDTIIAISTPVGKSAIGIIRISGFLVIDILKKFFKKIPEHKKASLSKFIDLENNILDIGILIYFKKPNSFTGEDLLEFHGHGNYILLNNIINIIVSFFNLRIAYPGEFSCRALINNKLSLLEIESILELIESENYIHTKISTKSYFYRNFNKKINFLLNICKTILVLSETYISFSEEDNLNNNSILKQIYNKKNILKKELNKLFNSFDLNNFIKNGIKISIIGKPNVGKSTLFNNLIKKNRSIVTNIAGTTRDIIYHNLLIDGIYYKFIDTAGIHKTDNYIEKIGINKTIKEIYNSDYIIYVTDCIINEEVNIYLYINKILENININKKIIYKKKFIFLINKSDILNKKIEYKNINNFNIIYISALKNMGTDLIINIIKNNLNLNKINLKFLLNSRHFYNIKKSLKLINNNNIINDFALFILDIENISKYLSNIINKKNIINNIEILNEIFSKFCIGK